MAHGETALGPPDVARDGVGITVEHLATHTRDRSLGGSTAVAAREVVVQEHTHEGPTVMTHRPPAPDDQRPGPDGPLRGEGLRTPVAWGVLCGCLQAASPLAFPRLDAATVYALGLVLIAAVYIGFGVADGRSRVVVVEVCVASAFVLVAALGVTGSAWLLVAGLGGHGLKDLWQHRTRFVANTRWWPPFCATVDVVAAALVSVAIVADIPVGW